MIQSHPEDWVISKLPWRKEGSYQKPILKKLPQAIVDEWGATQLRGSR